MYASFLSVCPLTNDHGGFVQELVVGHLQTEWPDLAILSADSLQILVAKLTNLVTLPRGWGEPGPSWSCPRRRNGYRGKGNSSRRTHRRWRWARSPSGCTRLERKLRLNWNAQTKSSMNEFSEHECNLQNSPSITINKAFLPKMTSHSSFWTRSASAWGSLRVATSTAFSLAISSAVLQ